MSLQAQRTTSLKMPAPATQVKLYIKPEDEIRRFNLESGSNFAALELRVKQLVGRDSFRLFWQDVEGDFIVCGSDEELNEARQLRDAATPLRLFVRPSKMSSGRVEGKKVHRLVTCDGCQGEVAGTRYKCMECEDYDLCEKCEGEGKHQDHDMFAIRTPKSHDWKKVFAHGYGSREGSKGHHGRRGPCGNREPGCPMGPPPAGFPMGPRFPMGPPPAFINHMMNAFGPSFDKTVEMDINMNRPLHEVLADVAKKVAEAVNVARNEEVAANKEAQDKKQSEETPQKETEQKETEETKMSEEEIRGLAKATTDVAEAVSMVAETVLQSVESLTSQENEAGWTHLEAETVEEEHKKEVEKPQPDQLPAPQQPVEGRVEAALRAMGEMGFPNEGNLLRRLLENYNGDISRVLDSIK